MAKIPNPKLPFTFHNPYNNELVRMVSIIYHKSWLEDHHDIKGALMEEVF